ncbi:ubiquitin-conjugating enzyme E2 R1-like [Drosophila miranda]|uniref:ubiquitin-conjugating enzyme E2 R1-like n=1 Tax=Drosophila miranda TaxID=7229 RepID=UPI00143F0C04|nr:ubiquitin-conjugating enzyme E2 R1-like [Drosophila miranda]
MSDSEETENQSRAVAVRVLLREFTELQEGKLEGFHVKLVREGDLFDWEVGVFGPPHTVYHGAYLKASMQFPPDYPMQPPDFFFRTKMFHPNVHASGMVCMSVLYDGCWNATMSARSVLLSVVSLLTGPDLEWPCDMEAAVLYNRWRDSDGTDKEYPKRVALQKHDWEEMARLDGVTVPVTVEQYCRPGPPPELPDEEEDFGLADLEDSNESSSASEEDGDEPEDVDSQYEKILWDDVD